MTDIIINNDNIILVDSSNQMVEYNNVRNNQHEYMKKADTILNQFIKNETHLLKKRMLSVYERVCPSKVNKLKDVFTFVSYGPIKMPNVSLIDNNRRYSGTLICYKYAAPLIGPWLPAGYQKRVLAFMYTDQYGKQATKYYAHKPSQPNYAELSSNDLPQTWCEHMIPISESEAGPLIEFLKEDYDLGELGDKYNAIVDFHDVEGKLRTGVDYYWIKYEHDRAQRAGHLLNELRTATMMYENRTGIDIQQHEWEHVQGLLQKALVALQMA